MEMNPIFRRESRVLWRGDRPFILLLLYALLLSGLIVVLYEARRVGATDLDARIALDGATLFRSLAYLGLGTWLLVVPVTAAPLLAFERERGLLESLQLSGVAAWRIVAGKFATVLSFALLLWMAGAPPLAICFYLGGVSPQEWTQVLALQFATIITGAALGLYVSSRARRVQTALRDTILLVAAWIFFAHFSEYIAGAIFAFIRWFFLGIGTFQNYAVFTLYLSYTDPFSVLEMILRNPASRPLGFAPIAMPVADEFVSTHLKFQLAATLFFLWRATINAGRALPEAQWAQRRRYLTLRKGRLQTAPLVAPSEKQPKEQSVFDVPLVSLLRFRNPVLQREVRSLFRMRRHSILLNILLACGALSCAGAYALALLTAWGEPTLRNEVWQNLTWVLFYGVLLAAPLRGANAIARERENGTWESLRLSRLDPHTILIGKTFAPLVFLACLILVMAPVWLPCINWLGLGRGVSFSSVLAAVALLFATAFGFTSWGLWMSWRSRSAASATGWTAGTLFVGLFAINFISVPLVGALVSALNWLYVTFYRVVFGITVYQPSYYNEYSDDHLYPQFYRDNGYLTHFLTMLSPIDAMSHLISERASYYNYSGYYLGDGISQPTHAFIAAGVQAFIGGLILLDVRRRMKNARFLEQELAGRRGRKAKTRKVKSAA